MKRNHLTLLEMQNCSHNLCKIKQNNSQYLYEHLILLIYDGGIFGQQSAYFVTKSL